MIEADLKDWTWVLERPCPECGYDARSVDRLAVGAAIRADAAGWSTLLGLPDVAARPDSATWSPLEYACHVRDVHRVMGERLTLLLDHDDPRFDNWDQDATAVRDRYDQQAPVEVAVQVDAAATAVAEQYDALVDAAEATWNRRGRRSNGSEFTVDSLARYHLHDVVHHAHDVRRFVARATAAAYDASAAAYSASTGVPRDHARPRLERFARAVGPGGRVLEIGTGGGHDAVVLEELGLAVLRTDVSAGFVAGLRERGHRAEVLDPLTDDLGGPYDGVWANACLLHVARPDLPVALTRLAAATRQGGSLGLSLKEGDGEAWSTHGSVRSPRHFVFWREDPLRSVLAASGWTVEELTVEHSPFNEQPWLMVAAQRAC